METVRKCHSRGCHTRASGLWLTSDNAVVALCAECGFAHAKELLRSFSTPYVDKPVVDISALPRKPDVRKIEAIKLIERASGETVKTFIYQGEQ